MKRSIFKLLCILYLTVVTMAEPPEKKFKIEAVAKAHRIIRNSVVVPVPPIVPIITPAVVLAPPVVPIVLVPPVVPIVAGGDYETVAGQSWYQTKSGVWKKVKAPAGGSFVAESPVSIVAPPIFPPVILADSASVGLRAGYYQTANGQWKKKPTPRSTVTSGIVSPAPRTTTAPIPVAISPASNSSIAGGATSAIISSAAQIPVVPLVTAVPVVAPFADARRERVIKNIISSALGTASITPAVQPAPSARIASVISEGGGLSSTSGSTAAVSSRIVSPS
jgi:hypothetical protein